ncbi:50S ribosomal protein L21 [Hyphomonas adhaerens MHS-3]|uniref:Large ribosomal subunit protein bL21 n=1 Tax=Hyphomonas adhaerens MHS-3 TaxID=1280949 RepID=A0A069E9K5_9PROT|nr:50S ribosomal protein L21 [Hyphomonas adhaerens]KCZ86041.1 50S ribosomal protein L21 [Hyphomonas adhaerens MHS-3]|tara:strand:- start:4317 stop:4943 length:627 start_codon:yes stop_codon:yes gene_type:complete
MFAVIKTGGKQYKVAEGDTIVVEKLNADAGKDVVFDTVLMLGEGANVTVGAPLVAGAAVTGEVAEQTRGDKVITRKKRQRQTYRRTIGHKQHLTVVKITGISADGAKKPAKKAAAKTEEAPKAEAAAPKAEAAAAPAAEAGAADNLKKMTGIGPALEKKLNGAGITTFAQVAALTDAQIAELEEQLGLSGRFEKDGWVEQAKELAKDA